MKSLRESRANIAESYVSPEGGEIWLDQRLYPRISAGQPLQPRTARAAKAARSTRSEIGKLVAAVQREGMTIVPLKIYFNDRGMAKVEIAVAQGKKLHDKRETEKERDWAREKGRLLREKG